jgi:hypothetical protein
MYLCVGGEGGIDFASFYDFGIVSTVKLVLWAQTSPLSEMVINIM